MKKSNGFTLLEILMAISIFAIVISLAYASYNASFRIINSASSQSEIYAQARTAMTRIREDLESFFPGETVVFSGSSDTLGGQRADTLEFSSTASVQFHPWQVNSGSQIIQYATSEDPEKETLQLFRSQRPALSTGDGEEDEKDPTELLLCDNLLEVAFDYRDKEGIEQQTWGDEETDTEEVSVPEMIRITLRFAENDEDEEGVLFQTAVLLPATPKEKKDDPTAQR
jgi:general secretion pathway protein J